MSASSPPGRRKPKSDFTALSLLIGMVLAVAVTGGASFSAAGSGALRQGLRALGFGRDTEIQAEQRKQATTLAEIERVLNRMDNEIGGLSTRMMRAEANGTAASSRLARLDGSLATLGTNVDELRARSETGGGEQWRKPVDHLNTAVTGVRTDILALRSSLDAFDQSRRSDVGALTKRIERLEQAITAADATASIPNAPASRGGETSAPSGVMGVFGLRGTGAGEPSTGHVIDMSGAGH